MLTQQQFETITSFAADLMLAGITEPDEVHARGLIKKAALVMTDAMRKLSNCADEKYVLPAAATAVNEAVDEKVFSTILSQVDCLNEIAV